MAMAAIVGSMSENRANPTPRGYKWPTSAPTTYSSRQYLTVTVTRFECFTCVYNGHGDVLLLLLLLQLQLGCVRSRRDPIIYHTSNV